ncbi:MAG: DUF362 domain-containing protein, partial [Synergistaceae bacterium]|nr:DUF362 domain-containing protein [Synergistaceae bacterium]
MKRHFNKLLCAALALLVLCFTGASFAAPVQSAARDNVSVVYFTKDISPAGLIKVYDMISKDISGRTAIKLHTGEQHGPNLLPLDMAKALQRRVTNSSLVETNTYYAGDRDTTEKHRETIRVNGFDFCRVDIMDENGYVMLPVKGGKHFKEMAMGKNILNYDSMVVYTHFKGHTMGGYGGSMKNIAIGNADGKVGKAMIHAKGGEQWGSTQDEFMERMAESAKATIDHFGRHITFINVMKNMSVDCDCAGRGAAKPTVRDIGVFGSTDLVAVDQACIDALYAMP